METKKYTFTEETKVYAGRTLHRIKALKDFGNIKAGDIGGWVEKESNLSQKGDCWVGDNARVYEESIVRDNARVYGNATVYGNAEIRENAEIFDNAVVCDNACAYGCVCVGGYNCIYGNDKAYSVFLSVEEKWN